MKPNLSTPILCLGDSLTEGFGVSNEFCYPTLLQKRLLEYGFKRQVINAGRSGDTTKGVLWRLERLLTQSVDMAILTIGLNDGFMGVPVTTIHKNLESIIQKLQHHHIRVILSGLQLPSDFPNATRKEFAALYPALAAQHNLHLIPFFQEGVFEDPTYNQWDNVHPNEAGYRVILETIWKVVSPLLTTEDDPVT
ncbi:MAG: arylesterase [Magnetococcus sp. THC-1_WYH]